MTDRPIFIDIDGTLTDCPKGEYYGAVFMHRVRKVRDLIKSGANVVIWSARGTGYAEDFCSAHGLFPIAAIGKPEKVVDDNPEIRPNWSRLHVDPNIFFDGVK